MGSKVKAGGFRIRWLTHTGSEVPPSGLKQNSHPRGLPPQPPRPFSPVKARGRRGAKRFLAIANSPPSKPGGEGGPSVFSLSRTLLRQSPGAMGEPSGFSLSRTLLRQSPAAIGRPGLTSSTQTVRCLAKPTSDRSRLESARRVGSRKTNLCLGASGSNCSLVFH